jgi:hypothetical protein
MTLDWADMIPQVLWPEAYSTAGHIKMHLPHSIFKLTKSRYKIIFDDKPSNKPLYAVGSNGDIHIPKEKQIGMSMLSLRGIKYFVIRYTESSKIFQLYVHQ